MSEDKKTLFQLKLGPYDRIMITNLLPARASVQKGIVISNIKDDLSFDDEELDKYNVQFIGNSISINVDEDKIENREFNLHREKLRIIQEALKNANNNGNIPTEKRAHELYNKIVNIDIDVS